MGSPTLTVLRGEASGSDPKARRLQALLAVAGRDSAEEARRMTALAERMSDPRIRARLMVLAAFCRAHSSRCLNRLDEAKVGLRCLSEATAWEAQALPTLLQEAQSAAAFAVRLEKMAALAREAGDFATAWVCELNRAEEVDRARELTGLAQAVGP